MYIQIQSILFIAASYPCWLVILVARERHRGDRPPSNVWGDIYLVNVGRQGILCLLAVKKGVGVAT